jgi:hypothetical protein
MRKQASNPQGESAQARKPFIFFNKFKIRGLPESQTGLFFFFYFF